MPTGQKRTSLASTQPDHAPGAAEALPPRRGNPHAAILGRLSARIEIAARTRETHLLMANPDVIVIGAGVVGLSAAIAAQGRGLSVLVLDKTGPAAGASAGNAGAFAFTDILPLASPGIIGKAPKWLLDPLGPLSVPPAYALRIAPWMFRFWRACSPARVAHSTAAQTALMELSKAELEPFLRETGTFAMLRKDGNLQVYEGKAELEASLPGWQARADHGIEFRHLDAPGMAAIQPGLAPRFTHGTFTPGWYSIADPQGYTIALAEHVRARGGTVERLEVESLEPRDDGVTIRAHNGQTRQAAQVVLAAGAFSHRIVRSLGERIPLETERGYNTTLPPDAFDCARRSPSVAMASSSAACRSASASVGPSSSAGSTCPRISAARRRCWPRPVPSCPASSPMTARSGWASAPRCRTACRRSAGREPRRRVVYAFGHGHLGLTQSAGTARLVADLWDRSAPGHRYRFLFTAALLFLD
jgi:D-amino-acid dehydrogenase